MTRFITFEYKNGPKLTNQWDEILDGKWPYPNNCTEVIFKINENKY